ncbi:MAG: hypothetical protein Q7S00_00905, partial [bacterium]|nr:hypothetical protein [bacterium]
MKTSIRTKRRIWGLALLCLLPLLFSQKVLADDRVPTFGDPIAIQFEGTSSPLEELDSSKLDGKPVTPESLLMGNFHGPVIGTREEAGYDLLAVPVSPVERPDNTQDPSATNLFANGALSGSDATEIGYDGYHLTTEGLPIYSTKTYLRSGSIDGNLYHPLIVDLLRKPDIVIAEYGRPNIYIVSPPAVNLSRLDSSHIRSISLTSLGIESPAANSIVFVTTGLVNNDVYPDLI